MNADTAYGHIERIGLMAGLRGAFPAEVALKVTGALMREGVHVFEFLMNSEEPIAAMQAVKREYGEAACVGMGTVLDANTCRQALDAGADFIVSPAFNPAVVQLALGADVLVAPGVITPTECVDAWAMGVKLLKLFPIGSLGIDYFKTLRGPLDHMRFMCNGGTNEVNVRQFMEAGAMACGMGPWLVGDGKLPLDTIQKRARQLRDIILEVRMGHPRRTVV
jgi:2-dehydro-3-deoxyphosphogluconate aldolase / (4S)-4-hydroxy-2-oxoglutarate aldolase